MPRILVNDDNNFKKDIDGMKNDKGMFVPDELLKRKEQAIMDREKEVENGKD